MTEGKGKHDKVCFDFEGSIFRFLCCEVPHVSNILVMGQSNALLQGQKNCGCTFALMNRNKNKYPETYSIFPWISV
jgi:hypothetical protein